MMVKSFCWVPFQTVILLKVFLLNGIPESRSVEWYSVKSYFAESLKSFSCKSFCWLLFCSVSFGSLLVNWMSFYHTPKHHTSCHHLNVILPNVILLKLILLHATVLVLGTSWLYTDPSTQDQYNLFQNVNMKGTTKENKYKKSSPIFVSTFVTNLKTDLK